MLDELDDLEELDTELELKEWSAWMSTSTRISCPVAVALSRAWPTISFEPTHLVTLEPEARYSTGYPRSITPYDSSHRTLPGSATSIASPGL